MNERHRQAFQAKFKEWFNDAQAEEFALMMVEIAHVWDDVVDCEITAYPERASQAFNYILIDIHYNQFFNTFKHRLLPIMQMIITSWQTANYFEDNQEELHKSFILRAMIYSLFAEIARCLGKDVQTVSNEAWRLYGENFDDFTKEIIQCQTQSQP